MTMKTAYSFSKNCQANCEHLDRGSCRECVEKALTAFADEQIANEYAKGALDQQAKCEAHKLKARAEALEEAAKAADEVGADSEEGREVARRIRALKTKAGGERS